MTFNDMLTSNGIPPQSTVVFRHRPTEPELRKALPWFAAERPELFNAYQQTQASTRVENVLKLLTGNGYVASFIGHEPGKALFVALYKIDSSRPLTRKEFRQSTGFGELTKLGSKTWVTDERTHAERSTVEWFELTMVDFYTQWKGKLIVDWPPPERAWWRRAHNNVLSIRAIHEESLLDADMPEWQNLNFSWDELHILPARWKERMTQWRGIYYIFDVSDHRGYVGSAYGKDNIMGRWENYAATGHGGNKLLRGRNPSNFRFTILERVSPDLDPDKVVRIEVSWKERLHTIAPYGYNEN